MSFWTLKMTQDGFGYIPLRERLSLLYGAEKRQTDAIFKHIALWLRQVMGNVVRFSE